MASVLSPSEGFLGSVGPGSIWPIAAGTMPVKMSVKTRAGNVTERTIDGQSMTAFALRPEFVGAQRIRFLTTPTDPVPLERNYKGIEIAARKRMSDGWQFTGSLNLGRYNLLNEPPGFGLWVLYGSGLTFRRQSTDGDWDFEGRRVRQACARQRQREINVRSKRVRATVLALNGMVLFSAA